MTGVSRRRLVVLHLIVASLLLGLGGRVWYLQVMAGTSYASLAQQDQVRKVIVPPIRGEITDDTGTLLVGNRSSLVVSVNMSVVSQRPGGPAELRRLAAMLHMRASVLLRKVRLCTAGVQRPCWAGSPYQPIPVAEHVRARVAVQVLETHRKFPGVTAEVQPVIKYQGAVSRDAAQMLGYLQPITPAEVNQRHLSVTGFSGVDLVGQSGLEEEYDRELRGRAGTQQVAVNAAGDVTGTIKRTPARAGDTLVTSINAKIQVDTQDALSGAIAQLQAAGNTGATTGAAVVMTTTGRIVAMASYPTYSPAVWTGGITTSEFSKLFGPRNSEPILNRVTQGQYAPGSTWKVTSAAAAVADGYSLAGPYNCPGSLTIAGRVFNNDFNEDSGEMSLHQALVVSCDTVFYQLAYQTWLRDHPGADTVTSPRAPVQEMQKMELGWGFGKDTGVDLPEESPGTVPTRAWLYHFYQQYKHFWCSHGRASGTYLQQIDYDDCVSGNVWTPGQAVNAAIGQGYVTVTPLQLARAYVALANGGTLYSPRIGEALVSPSGRVVRRIRPPVAGHLPVSAGTLAYIRDALGDVVTQGTAAPAFAGFPLSQLQVAGKTGTAQVEGKVATSVFASFAPLQHPRYVVVMMIPDSGYGADVSAPAVRQIWDGIYGLEGHKAALPGGRLPSHLPPLPGIPR